MVDYVGQQLGNYRLSKIVGTGGSASVYLGEHIYLNTPAAIKVLQLQLASNALENFLSEARTIARLTHPNIIPVLEFGIEDTTPFLVMGYAPYGSLRQRHPEANRVAPATIVSYVKQISLALHYAHTNKIIHRDVKPENMLLGQDERVLLSDFGIAVSAQTRSENTTQSQQVQQAQHPIAGTCTYMAPEQLQGQPTFASDQYALGIAVYEWFCGSPPFNGSMLDVALQHLQTPPLLLSEKLPGISPAIEHVVMRSLSKDPAARFDTIQLFASALEQACTMAVVQASAPTITAFPPFAHPTTPASSMARFRSQAPQSTPTPYAPTTTSITPGQPITPLQLLHAIDTPGRSGMRGTPTPLPSQQTHLSRRTIAALSLGGLTLVGLSVLGAENAWQTLFATPNTASTQPTSPHHSQPTPRPTPDVNATPRAIINSTSSRPALTSASPGTLDLFVRGSDNALWHRNFNGTSWQNWESLGGILSYDPVVSAWSPGRFDVFVRHTDNSILHKFYDGSWHDWEPLGGLVTADPSITSWAPGRLDLFVRGAFNDLWIKTFDGSWHDWAPLGGSFSSSPTAASSAPGHLDIFVRDAYNSLWTLSYDGAWHPWQPLQGTFLSDPSVTSWGPGRLDLFVRGTDNSLKHKWYQDTTWYDWESPGGTLPSSPTSIALSNNHLEVFARNTDTTLQHTWFDGTWHPWQPYI